jgi:NAD(P)-dependent dehydrogenase (short-subunit alcohol dehydrogenase family)
MGRLDGKVAIITGGANGQGAMECRMFANEGAKVIIADIAGEEGQKLEAEINEAGGIATFMRLDVTDEENWQKVVDDTVTNHGRLDILVNNAGARPGPDRVPVVELEEAAWDEVQNVNLKGTFLCCRAVSRHMIDRGKGGKIINMSSTSGRHGRARFAAYCASKFGVRGFTQALALELAPHHINVNAICPGAVDTERVGYILEATSSEDISAESWRTSEHRQAFIQERARNIPLGRMAQPSDVARLAAFLASSQSDYLTGLSVNIDGGCEMD